jgi:hypothetical protein
MDCGTRRRGYCIGTKRIKKQSDRIIKTGIPKAFNLLMIVYLSKIDPTIKL